MRIAERTGALLLAVRRAPEAPLEPNPAGDLRTPAGAVLIALGSQEQLAEARASSPPSPPTNATARPVASMEYS